MDTLSELALERATLAKSDIDLRQGQARVDLQAARVLRMRDAGGDGREAERLLALFEQTMVNWRTHRTLILQRIAHLETRAALEEAATAGYQGAARP